MVAVNPNAIEDQIPTFMAPIPRLPSEAVWSFRDIERSDPARASLLETAGSPNDLIGALKQALDTAINCNEVQLALEQARRQECGARAVVQFNVGSRLFDWFFNARTGYRAHYWAHYKCGLRFNNRIVEALREILTKDLSAITCGHQLDSEFRDRGEAQIPKGSIVDSLRPYLAKASLCTKLLQPDGVIKEVILGTSGPKIWLDEYRSWAAPYPEGKAAWIELKGAFLGRGRPCQPKHPFKRARDLHTTGTL